MYEQGSGVPQDYHLAMNWYMKAAEQNRPEAEYKVGYLYEHGQGVSANRDQAIAWYERSNKHGSAMAEQALKALEQ